MVLCHPLGYGHNDNDDVWCPEVVGVRFPSGETVGCAPDVNLPHRVCK